MVPIAKAGAIKPLVQLLQGGTAMGREMAAAALPILAGSGWLWLALAGSGWFSATAWLTNGICSFAKLRRSSRVRQFWLSTANVSD